MAEETPVEETASKPTKAIFAGIISFLTGLGVPLVGDAGLGDVTIGQWVVIVLGTVVSVGAVYGITNKPVN